jgi:hypothetical protein
MFFDMDLLIGVFAHKFELEMSKTFAVSLPKKKISNLDTSNKKKTTFEER